METQQANGLLRSGLQCRVVSQAVQLVTACQVNGQHSGGKSEKSSEQEG